MRVQRVLVVAWPKTEFNNDPVISARQLEFLRKLEFLWCKIATVLNIDRRTLFRWRKKLNIDVGYTVLTDQELDEILVNILKDTPNLGKTCYGCFKSKRNQHT